MRAGTRAIELIRFCAVLASDSIPEYLFTECAHLLPPKLRSTIINQKLFNEAIADLLKYSLIQRDARTKSIIIHRLVQVVINDEMTKKQQDQWKKRITHIISYLFPFVESTSVSSLPRWIFKGYQHVKWESFYEIHNDNPQHHTFIVKVEIEAIRPGVYFFADTYRWTGNEKENSLTVLSPNHKLMPPIIQKNGWNHYYIHLGQHLNIGDKSNIVLKHDLYDEKKQFQPFLSKIINHPLEELILQVKLPIKNLPSEIYFDIFDSELRQINVSHEPGYINEQTGIIWWKVLKPTFGYRYTIPWHS